MPDKDINTQTKDQQLPVKAGDLVMMLGWGDFPWKVLGVFELEGETDVRYHIEEGTPLSSFMPSDTRRRYMAKRGEIILATELNPDMNRVGG